jgi:hypothetical protein
LDSLFPAPRSPSKKRVSGLLATADIKAPISSHVEASGIDKFKEKGLQSFPEDAADDEVKSRSCKNLIPRLEKKRALLNPEALIMTFREVKAAAEIMMI